jgi:biopolymer transport protein ExbD
MPKVKIPRKSTAIDMTAMCDVAFLLLSFFILATKQKPPEAVAVKPPNSVSTEVVAEDAILTTLTKEGKALLMIGKESFKKEILQNINETKALGLSAAELEKWNKQELIGTPLNMVKSLLSSPTEIAADKLPGIPTEDTTSNELVDWYRSAANVYAVKQIDQKDLEKRLLIKGDVDALYPKFKAVKFALKKNGFFKFFIVTNGAPPPVGSEMYIENKLGEKQK